jgi:predicted transcriptional regulator
MTSATVDTALDDLVARLKEAASHYHATRTALFREAVTAITALRARVDELETDRAWRNKNDPITRLHNLCAGLEEHKKDSPYSAESWALQDEAYQEKCKQLKAAQSALAERERELREALRKVAIRSKE